MVVVVALVVALVEGGGVINDLIFVSIDGGVADGAAESGG